MGGSQKNKHENSKNPQKRPKTGYSANFSGENRRCGGVDGGNGRPAERYFNGRLAMFKPLVRSG